MAERAAIGGVIAGFVLGFGAASFGWLNPYAALEIVLLGIAYIVVIGVAMKQRRPSKREERGG